MRYAVKRLGKIQKGDIGWLSVVHLRGSVYYIYLQPLSNIPAPTATITTGQMEKRLLNLEQEVQQIKASLEHVKK